MVRDPCGIRSLQNRFYWEGIIGVTLLEGDVVRRQKTRKWLGPALVTAMGVEREEVEHVVEGKH